MLKTSKKSSKRVSHHHENIVFRITDLLFKPWCSLAKCVFPSSIIGQYRVVIVSLTLIPDNYLLQIPEGRSLTQQKSLINLCFCPKNPQ